MFRLHRNIVAREVDCLEAEDEKEVVGKKRKEKLRYGMVCFIDNISDNAQDSWFYRMVVVVDICPNLVAPIDRNIISFNLYGFYLAS